MVGTTSIDTNEFLEHFGTKGMKWGVRNAKKVWTWSRSVTPRNQKRLSRGKPSWGGTNADLAANRELHASKKEGRQPQFDFSEHGAHGPHAISPGKARRLNKADARWQKNVYSMRGAIDVHNHVADQMNNGELDALNNTPKYKNHVDKGGKLLDPERGFEPAGKIGKEYLADYHNRVEKATAKAVTAVHGTSPSGKFKATYKNDKTGGGPRVEVAQLSPVAHAVEGMDALMPNAKMLNKQPTLLITVDQIPKTGQIGTHHMVDEESDLKQSDAAGEFLEHYGVKGMRWGVRNARSKSSSSNKRGGKGTNNKKKPHEMTDEELKGHVARLELEKKYVDLAKHSKSKGSGKAFVAELGKNSAKIATGAATTFAVNKALKAKFGG